MKLDKKFWLKLGVESLLIIFSVLLALALNELRTSRKEAEATELALRSIQEELRANLEILAAWQQRHQEILDTLEVLTAQPQPQEFFFDQGRFLFEKTMAGGSFIHQMVRSTAWETARTTGTLQHVDPELLRLLTDVYALQGIATSTTLERVLALVFDRQTHQPEQLNTTLVLLKMNMQELKGQENLLERTYRAAIEALSTHLDE